MNLTHGHASDDNRSPVYSAWANMVQRCTNPKSPRWKDWGGRGITICKRWLIFENFLRDMGERPKGMSLDRDDNDGNYGPKNCKWSTSKEQAAHRRSKGFSKNNTSGTRYVYWHKTSKRWFVAKHTKGRLKSFGYFSTKEAAVEFAKTNF